MIIYEGPSMLNGEPIVAIATGLTRKTENRKTGKMIQIWILHADMLPTAAIRSGEDSAICGTCPHRGVNGKHRSCYVVVAQAPTQIWKTYQKGGYEHGTIPPGLSVRFGAYGDPAALPVGLLRKLAGQAKHHTGYTHAWRQRRMQGAKKFLMASVDTYAEHMEAQALGWRTFRPLIGKMRNALTELSCPNYTHQVQCASCGLCSGANGAKSITVPAHGAPAVHIRRNLKLAGVA